MKDYLTIAGDVKKIVLQASEFALSNEFEVFQKGDIANIVTSADLKVQKFLEEKLVALLPESGFFGEESAPENADRKLCWIVDPIDGTQNFSRHLNQSAISVALRDGESVVVGVVYNPFNKEMYWAAKGHGSYLNDKKLHVSARPFKDCLFCTSLPVYHKEYGHICAGIIDEIFPQINDFRRFGACSLEICYLASGRADIYFEYNLAPWDYSAASLVLTEAGGVYGSPLDGYLSLSKPCPVIAANNRENYEKLKAICAKHMGPRWPA